MLSISFAPKQANLIHNLVCFLIGQTPSCLSVILWKPPWSKFISVLTSFSLFPHQTQNTNYCLCYRGSLKDRGFVLCVRDLRSSSLHLSFFYSHVYEYMEQVRAKQLKLIVILFSSRESLLLLWLSKWCSVCFVLSLRLMSKEHSRVLITLGVMGILRWCCFMLLLLPRSRVPVPGLAPSTPHMHPHHPNKELISTTPTSGTLQVKLQHWGII